MKLLVSLMIAEITHDSQQDDLPMIADMIICACRNLPLGEGSSTHRNLNSIIHDTNRLVNCAHDKVQTVSVISACATTRLSRERGRVCGPVRPQSRYQTILILGTRHIGGRRTCTCWFSEHV